MLCESGTVRELTQAASVKIISEGEMAALRHTIVEMPEKLKVTSKCVVKVHLRETENGECERCGQFNIDKRDDGDPFRTLSAICDECTTAESEFMNE